VGVAAGLRLRLSPPVAHPLGSEAHEIETHIRETQPPANLLGIGVAEVDEGSLALHAPLELNHNVHGTAFAGSLYSVGVLASYYLGRAWVRRQPQGSLPPQLELVAKAGSISYRRPVKGERIIARSQLPAEPALREFAHGLRSAGKASCQIGGVVLGDADGKPACEYSIEVCAYVKDAAATASPAATSPAATSPSAVSSSAAAAAAAREPRAPGRSASLAEAVAAKVAADRAAAGANGSGREGVEV